jgi:hypothetical protein
VPDLPTEDDARRLAAAGLRLRTSVLSGKAPDVMDRLIHLALSGGEGDVLKGFDRMFERLGRTSAR